MKTQSLPARRVGHDVAARRHADAVRAVWCHRGPLTARLRRLGGLAACALALSGCAVELRNLAPAQDLVRADQPPGSLYVGWRVYQDRCARCHGPSAAGGSDAPDLRVSLQTMGPRRFMDAVLRRYDWNLSPADETDSAGRDTRLDDVMQRRRGELSMPDWQGEPRVTAHIADLYAYLAARADGALAPGRPAR